MEQGYLQLLKQIVKGLLYLPYSAESQLHSLMAQTPAPSHITDEINRLVALAVSLLIYLALAQSLMIRLRMQSLPSFFAINLIDL